MAFTKEGSTWTKVVFEVLGSQEKEEDQGKTRRGEERKGKKRKRGVSNFFKIKCKNKVIEMYGNCKSTIDAHRVFDHMPNRNMDYWHLMMHDFANNTNGDDALYSLSL